MTTTHTHTSEWAVDRVGVDVLQLPKTRQGNRYAIVFMGTT